MSEDRLLRLLAPHTPQEVAERYRSLSRRAAANDFGLLVDDIVVLDTETTGLSFRDCDLIQIAAARLEGGAVAERFDTYVRPKGHIPPEIVKLTGITDEDVRGAPSPDKAVGELAAFVGGMPILAHNAIFDRTFVEMQRHGDEVSDLWIDTLALSRIALPRLVSHRLADMADAFGCASVTHRAVDDVDALCGMWPIMLQALSDLPRGLISMLSFMHPEVSWPFRPILGHLAAGDESEVPAFSLREVRKLLVGEHASPRPDVAELPKPLAMPTTDEVRAAFAPGGIVGAMYASYEERPDQLAMALEVREALADGSFRAIEAGTGVGKSIAYLVPEVTFAQRNRVTVGIATKTNALADQLVTQELPALSSVLEKPLSFASLKGYEHYPCLRKLERAALGDLPPQPPDAPGNAQASASEMLTALAVTYAYACQSPAGDLDALGIRWRHVPRELLTTTSSECHRHRCPFYPHECFLHGARRMAAAADVIVTNHSLLLRNVMSEGRILPPVRNWVVDEAHGFEDEARRQWAREVAADEMRRGFERLGGLRAGVLHSLLIQVGRLDGAGLHVRLLTRLAACVARAQVSATTLHEALHGLVALADRSPYDRVTLWIDGRVRQTPEWGAVEEAGWAVVEHVDEAVKDLVAATEALSADSAQLGADLADAGRFLGELRSDLTLMLEGMDESYVYAADLARHRSDMGSDRLTAEKVDVGDDLAAQWLSEMDSVIFSSATIAVGDSFEHFDHAVGLDLVPRERRHGTRLRSSFDFDANMSVVVCKDLPQPGEPSYLRKLEDLLFDVHVAMGGSVLTLFTNRREMETVYRRLNERLAAVGLDLAFQGRGASTRRLRQRFVSDECLSLLALRSFWEGFDAAGDTLRCVVIPKLPFANPTDPLVRERERREDRSWWRYSLPEAVISVKQAAGRLIRSANDAGVLVLADSRLVSKRYGRQFISSLPSRDVSLLDTRDVKGHIERWRHMRGEL